MSFPKYPKYKDSGVEWLGEVPEHWGVKSLKHIVATPITDGPHETPNFPDEGIPFVSAEAVASGRIDFTKIRGFISVADHWRYSEKYRPQRGDIFMVKSGATTGVTAIVETDIEFNIWSPLAAIRCGAKAIPKFVLNFMRSRNFLEGVTLNWSFGTQQNIGMRVIENLAVSLPPDHEQTAIATFLDRETSKIDELVAEQQRLIELLNEKRQAVISHAVTKGLNPEAPLKPSGIEWLCDVPEHWTPISVRNLIRKGILSLQDGNHGESHPKASEFTSAGIPFLMAGDMNNGEPDLENCNFITASRASELRITPALAGDVLLSHKGNQLGEVATIPDVIDFPFVVLTPQITYYRIERSSLSRRFLSFVLRSRAFQDQLWFIASVQATRPYVGLTAQRELRFALPPGPEQEQIAEFLSVEVGEFEMLLAEAQKAIDLLQERRTALISAAVTGKIDVRGLAKTEAA